jgi:hypothetical protein
MYVDMHVDKQTYSARCMCAMYVCHQVVRICSGNGFAPCGLRDQNIASCINVRRMMTPFKHLS